MKVVYTFRRNQDGEILAIPGGSYKDAADAGSLRKALLFALLWAVGSKAGQLDTADKAEYLDGFLYPDGDAPVDLRFARSSNKDEVTAVVEEDCNLEETAKELFRFADTYRQKIYLNLDFMEKVIECDMMAGDYLRRLDEKEGSHGRYQKFYLMR